MSDFIELAPSITMFLLLACLVMAEFRCRQSKKQADKWFRKWNEDTDKLFAIIEQYKEAVKSMESANSTNVETIQTYRKMIDDHIRSLR